MSAAERETIQVNGKPENVEPGTSVRDYLASKGINPNVVACELNMKIIRRPQLGDAVLKSGDVLEVIRIIGGG